MAEGALVGGGGATGDGWEVGFENRFGVGRAVGKNDISDTLQQIFVRKFISFNETHRDLPVVLVK